MFDLKKRFLILAAVVVAVSCSCVNSYAQIPESEFSDITKAKAKPVEYMVRAQKIKVLKQTFYKYDEKTKALLPNPTYKTTRYNEAGLKTDEEYSDYDKKSASYVITDKYKFFYNEIKLLLKEEHYSYNSQKKTYDLLEVSDYSYSSNNNKLFEIKEYFKGKLSTITRYSYNQNAQEIECSEYDENNQQLSKLSTSYDEEGRMCETNLYELENNALALTNKTIYTGILVNKSKSTDYAAGKIEKVTDYVYDTGGDILEEKTVSADGKILDKKVYYYNDEGKLVEKTFYNKENQVYLKTTRFYNEKSLLVEERKFVMVYDAKIKKNELKLQSRECMVYDENGNVTDVTRYDENGLAITKNVSSYEYYKS